MKQSKREKQSASMSPTLAVISIIEFQTIWGILRKREAIESVQMVHSLHTSVIIESVDVVDCRFNVSEAKIKYSL